MAMNPDNNVSPSLKIRSKSMPLVSVLTKREQNQKMRNHQSKLQSEMLQALQNKQILDISNIKDQEAEEINLKLKILAERSMKKIQERYETIDKWKQKYDPEASTMLIRHKLSLDGNQTRQNIQIKHEPLLVEAEQEGKIVNTVKQKEKLLPIIIKKHVTPTIPDQRQQGRRLEQLLRQRLEKNKNYYELKSTMIEKEINYFQEINPFISPQKKRQLQLRKLLLKSDRDRAPNKGLFYKKISLSDPKLKRQLQGKNIKIIIQRSKSRLFDDNETLGRKSPIDKFDLKAKLMQEVKAKLMQEMVGATPQGWDIVNQMDSPQLQGLL